MVIKTIKARFTDGVLVPLAPLELAKDTVVFITLDTKGELAGWKEPDWTPTTPAETQEAEAATEEMIKYIYAGCIRPSSPAVSSAANR